MKYLTVQLLESARYDRRGVNAFLHRQVARLEVGEEPFRAVDRVSREPGELIGSHIELPPGGNAVIAFLDVIAGGEADSARFRALLEEARTALRGSSNEVAAALSDGYFRFYARPDQELPETFDILANKALTALESPRPVPFVALIRPEQGAVEVRLDAESVRRLQSLHGEAWAGQGVRLANDTANDFERVHGSVVPHLVEVLTGLPQDNAKALGGVTFVRPDGSRTTWPE